MKVLCIDPPPLGWHADWRCTGYGNPETDYEPCQSLLQISIEDLFAYEGITARLKQRSPILPSGAFMCPRCGAVTKVSRRLNELHTTISVHSLPRMDAETVMAVQSALRGTHGAQKAAYRPPIFWKDGLSGDTGDMKVARGTGVRPAPLGSLRQLPPRGKENKIP